MKLSELVDGKVDIEQTIVAPIIEEIEKEQELDASKSLVEETVAEAEKKRGRPAKVKEEVKEEPQLEEVTGGTTLEEVLSKSKSEKQSVDSVWSDVEKLTGESVEVDFEGEDPNSPEGAFKYIQSFADKKISDFEDSLATKYPKEYQALILRMNGEDPSILYKEDSYDYKTLALNEDDEDTQKAVLRQDMRSQGLSDKRVEALVKSIFDSGDLYTESKDSLDRLKQKQIEDYQVQQKQIEQVKLEQKQEINRFDVSVSEVIKKGQIGDFVIPEKDKESFHKFLADNVKYENGQFYAVIPLDKDQAKLNKQLQTEFFRFKGGNLKDIVVKQAITENSKRLKANIKEATKGNSGTERATNTHKHWQEEAGLR